jgi:phosphate-selective porin OprO/OprP
MPALMAVVLAGAAPGSLAAPPNLTFETDSGVKVALPWYLQWQWLRAHPDRTPVDDRFGFRRARLALEVERAGSWDFKAEYDLESGQWTDLAAGLRVGSGRLRVGQYRMPLGLEQGSSNRDAVLLERGLPNALVYARRLGIGYEWMGEGSSVRAAVFDRDLSRAEEASGVAMRATWAPIRGESRFLHLGLAAGTENLDGQTERFSARPDVGLVSWRAVDTGAIANVDRTDRYSVEAAWIHGPWSLQSEYVAARIDARAGRGTAAGWYLLGTWTVTGESRGYRDGLLRALKPSRPWGAVELAARVGRLGLDGGFLDGGVVKTFTLGANWYVNAALRISANVVEVDSRRRGLDDDPRLLEVRIQTQF